MKMLRQMLGGRCIVAGLAILVLAGVPIRSAGGTESGTPADPPADVADQVEAWTVDGGGGESAGGGFSLTGTIGQPEAAVLSKCGTVLAGGVWAGSVDLGAVFCDDFESGGTGEWSAVAGGVQ